MKKLRLLGNKMLSASYARTAFSAAIAMCCAQVTSCATDAESAVRGDSIVVPKGGALACLKTKTTRTGVGPKPTTETSEDVIVLGGTTKWKTLPTIKTMGEGHMVRWYNNVYKPVRYYCSTSTDPKTNHQQSYKSTIVEGTQGSSGAKHTQRFNPVCWNKKDGSKVFNTFPGTWHIHSGFKGVIGKNRVSNTGKLLFTDKVVPVGKAFFCDKNKQALGGSDEDDKYDCGAPKVPVPPYNGQDAETDEGIVCDIHSRMITGETGAAAGKLCSAFVLRSRCGTPELYTCADTFAELVVRFMAADAAWWGAPGMKAADKASAKCNADDIDAQLDAASEYIDFTE